MTRSWHNYPKEAASDGLKGIYKIYIYWKGIFAVRRARR